MARWAGAWDVGRSFVQERDDREREREENGGRKGGDWRRKKKGKAREGGGEAFEKLKSKAPSDGVGQGKRVTGRSNW